MILWWGRADLLHSPFWALDSCASQAHSCLAQRQVNIPVCTTSHPTTRAYAVTNLKCISECCSAFCNLSLKHRHQELQTRESEKENTDTSFLKGPLEVPSSADCSINLWFSVCSPMPLQVGTLVCDKDGKGGTTKKRLKFNCIWYCSQDSWGIKKHRGDTCSLLRRYLWKGWNRNIFQSNQADNPVTLSSPC